MLGTFPRFPFSQVDMGVSLYWDKKKQCKAEDAAVRQGPKTPADTTPPHRKARCFMTSVCWKRKLIQA